MRWPSAALATVAPARPCGVGADCGDDVWQLGLDQIETHTGVVLRKERRPAAEAGNSTFGFDTRHVLYSKLRPYLNKVVVPDEPGIATTELIPLAPDPKLLVREYLGYYLRSPTFLAYASHYVTGAKMPRIILRRFWEHEVPLPSLSEQRRIVEILDQADHLRRLRTEANTKADRILPALFLKTFGDPATNPTGWPIVHVGAVADVQGGLQLSRRRESNPIQVPYLRVANVYRDRLQLNEIKLLGVTEAELERTRLLKGDVLVVEGQGNKAEIGRCAVWNGSIDPCIHQNHLIRIRPDRSRVVPSFVSAYLNSAAGRQQLLKAGKTTSGLNTISVANVKKAVIFLPPLDRQERFDRASASVVANGQQACEASAALHSLWKQLLSRGFSGDLTRRWREPRMAELRGEMERQAAALARESS